MAMGLAARSSANATAGSRLSQCEEAEVGDLDPPDSAQRVVAVVGGRRA